MNYDYKIVVKNGCGVVVYEEVFENCIDENQAMEMFLDNNFIASGDTITVEEVGKWK